jgi:uncharacterized membrane protein YphA (DoxX/SURF4 family)
MKAVLNFIRVFTGVLFIFSGLIKGNDPLGLAYKMEEFFEVWNAGLASGSFFLKNILINFFHFLGEYSLYLSVVIIAFEIIAGAALLLGWRMKLFSWLLFLLMIFFTFLTGYTYYTGKPTNCGCFGDCLKITSEFSFWKDVILSVFILIILFTQKKIKPLFSPFVTGFLMIFVIVFSFGIQWYALKYLPPIDCLPFKKGNNIQEKMKMPANAEPDSIVMTFVYEKAGEKVEFTADKFPGDFNDSLYKFVNRYDKLIRKGKNNEPPIKGFSISGITNIDSTAIVLQLPYSLLLFEIKPTTGDWEKSFKEIRLNAGKRNIPLFIITTSIEEYFKMKSTDLPVFKCDFTAIRTAARANPTLYLLKNGTVENKWSYADFEKASSEIKKF